MQNKKAAATAAASVICSDIAPHENMSIKYKQRNDRLASAAINPRAMKVLSLVVRKRANRLTATKLSSMAGISPNGRPK